MTTSSAAREAAKKARTIKEINANINEPTKKIKRKGETYAYRKLHKVAHYSTKFMTKEDQFVLAVDRVDAPEVRIALVPANESIAIQTANYGTFDYVAKLSLNGGDKKAFKQLAEHIKKHPKTLFTFTNQNATKYMIFSAHPISDRGMSFVFNMYDGGTISGSDKIPSSSVSLDIYTDEMQNRIVWDYCVWIHSSENQRPKDSVIKDQYLLLQEYLRASIASIGITPSSL